MSNLQPQRPEARIVLTPPKRGSHQGSWPTVEVTDLVTVIAHESWGTRLATYEVVAQRVVDIRSGYTRDAVESAQHLAHLQLRQARREIEQANPDYATPARY